MEKEIRLFKEKFNNIRALGYVKAINNNNSGIGLTFEELLGKKADNFSLPDFQNVLEIKTKLAFSKKPIHLFKLTPEGTNFIETKSILEKYGYYQASNKNYKVFNGTISAKNIYKIGFYYYFSLSVNYKEEKVVLLVYDCNKKLIDNNVYWSFNKIENALIRKLKYLAIVYVWSTKKNGFNYYKYYRYDIYKYSNFYTFLNLLENGIINITFSIDIYKSNKRYGQIHDHGTSFNIDKNNIEKLFIKMY